MHARASKVAEAIAKLGKRDLVVVDGRNVVLVNLVDFGEFVETGLACRRLLFLLLLAFFPFFAFVVADIADLSAALLARCVAISLGRKRRSINQAGLS